MLQVLEWVSQGQELQQVVLEVLVWVSQGQAVVEEELDLEQEVLEELIHDHVRYPCQHLVLVLLHDHDPVLFLVLVQLIPDEHVLDLRVSGLAY
jgi:hypothetical protein